MMQSFKCVHCGGQIDVFDAKEAEREAIRQSESAKARAKMLDLIERTFREIPGVSCDQRESPRDSRSDPYQEMQLVVPKAAEASEISEGWTIREFEPRHLFDIIGRLVETFRDAVQQEGVPVSRYVPRTITSGLSAGEMWHLEIDGFPCRAIMSYQWAHAGWLMTIDAAYRKDGGHEILESIFR